LAVKYRPEPTVKPIGEDGKTAIEDNVSPVFVVAGLEAVVVGAVVGIAEVVVVGVAVVVVEVVEVRDTTVKTTAGLVIEPKVAVILAVPTATPVAKPVGSVVAIPQLSLYHPT
jgi:hypothetical protein